MLLFYVCRTVPYSILSCSKLTNLSYRRFFTSQSTSEDSLNAPDTPGSLDQAIESGNWEQVAASAAKYVMDHDESMPSSTSGAEV